MRFRKTRRWIGQKISMQTNFFVWWLARKWKHSCKFSTVFSETRIWDFFKKDVILMKNSVWLFIFKKSFSENSKILHGKSCFSLTITQIFIFKRKLMEKIQNFIIWKIIFKFFNQVFHEKLCFFLLTKINSKLDFFEFWFSKKIDGKNSKFWHKIQF